MAVEYYKGSDLPNLVLTWKDADGGIIDFSSGWTFQVKVGLSGETAEFTKTTGISGASTAPNVTITWAVSGELNDITAGFYTVQVKATRTSDDRERFSQTPIRVLEAIL